MCDLLIRDFRKNGALTRRSFQKAEHRKRSWQLETEDSATIRKSMELMQRDWTLGCEQWLRHSDNWRLIMHEVPPGNDRSTNRKQVKRRRGYWDGIQRFVHWTPMEPPSALWEPPLRATSPQLYANVHDKRAFMHGDLTATCWGHLSFNQTPESDATSAQSRRTYLSSLWCDNISPHVWERRCLHCYWPFQPNRHRHASLLLLGSDQRDGKDDVRLWAPKQGCTQEGDAGCVSLYR